MGTTGKLPARIRLALEAISENAMAISGISNLIYGLKLDCDSLDKEAEKEYPAFARFRNGLHDCDLARALEVMADDIKDHCDRIENYMSNWQWRQQMEAQMMQEALARDAAQKARAQKVLNENTLAQMKGKAYE